MPRPHKRLPFDEEMRRLIADGDGPLPAETPATDADRVRARRRLIDGALKARPAIGGLPNGVGTLEVSISDRLAGRIYAPPGAVSCACSGAGGWAPPVLVYFHGGGWVVGSIETHDPFCRLLCAASGAILLSVGYRLAPEHPFPAALEDALAAFRWAQANASEWGGDPARVAIGGDSAGANLAAVTANRVCGGTRPLPPSALMLLYPVTDHPDAGHPSYTENTTGYGLDAGLMRWFWDQYAAGVPADNPEISPLRMEPVPPLPPTLVATAEYDILRDEGLAYADKLEAAGIAVTRLHAADMSHNFSVHPSTVARFARCDETLLEIAGWLRKTLAGPRTPPPRQGPPETRF